MWFLLGTTLTASFFDSLNPSAIAQQMLLQATVTIYSQPVPAGCSATPYAPTPLLSWQVQAPVCWEKYPSRVLLSPGWY